MDVPYLVRCCGKRKAIGQSRQPTQIQVFGTNGISRGKSCAQCIYIALYNHAANGSNGIRECSRNSVTQQVQTDCMILHKIITRQMQFRILTEFLTTYNQIVSSTLVCFHFQIKFPSRSPRLPPIFHFEARKKASPLRP